MDELIRLIEEVLDCKINEDTNANNCESWDSLGHISIILAIQEKYNIKIKIDEIDRLKSVKDIYNYLLTSKVIV